ADRVWASPYGLRSRTLRTVAATAPDRPIGRPRATSTRCGGGVSRGTSVPPTTSAAGRGGPYGESPTEKWKPSTAVLPQRSGRTSFVVRRVHAPVRAAGSIATRSTYGQVLRVRGRAGRLPLETGLDVDAT